LAYEKRRGVRETSPLSAEREVKVISLRAKTCEVVENQGGVALFPLKREVVSSLIF
jgi:hypothetical protein